MKISINHALLLVLVYPLLLFIPALFGKEVFFITAPYFFLIFLIVVGLLGYTNILNNTTKVDTITFLLFLLVVCSIFNFSSSRYSLPIFFTFYCLVFFVYLNSLKNKGVSFELFSYYYILVLLLSVPMIFLSSGYTVANRFIGFIGSPTIYSGFLVSFFIIASYRLKVSSLKFILFFTITFYFVYLTKTRLLLIVILLYPALRLLTQKKAWASKKIIFLFFYLATLLIYPLYSLVINMFPSLVSLRYGKKADSSFGLRNYLFEELNEVFFSGNFLEKLFGRGNEFSRIYVNKLVGVDLFPHNDYLRIVIDWGFFGFIIFSYLLYKVATKNYLNLYLSLVYMVLFYSNTIFNLFLVSMLFIFYHNTNNEKVVFDFEKTLR